VGFKIVLADSSNPDHIHAIRRLWDDNLRFIAEGRYEWLYQQNPAGETITCLAVHEETGRIVGAASAMRRHFYVDRKRYTAGIAIDFAIDADYRVFGPALLLQRALADQAWAHGLDFMLGFPNLSSQGVLKRMGYEQVGKSLRFTQPVRTYDKLASMLRTRHLFPWLTRPAAAVLDSGLLLRNLLVASPGTVREFSTVDEWDAYWQEMWKKNSILNKFQGMHAADYVRWRYLCCPYRDYRVFGLFDGNQDLVAYLVCVVEDDMVLIDDFRYLERKWMSSLFRQFWRVVRSMGGKAVVAGLVVHGSINDLMTGSGFLPRPSERHALVLSNPGLAMDWKEALDRGDWYITDGEIDL